jgi:hypothetical protein
LTWPGWGGYTPARLFSYLGRNPLAFIWKPALWHSDYGDADDIYLLPQPVIQLDIGWSWKLQEHKVPRKSGATSYGLALDAVPISITGEFGKNASGVTDSEQEMWTELETLRSKLAAADDSEKLELFLYHDTSGGGTYRKLKSVRPVSLQPSVGDAARIVFGYQLVLMAEDVAVYTTAPGS